MYSVHRRLYLCHHASYRKQKPENNKKGKSKNYNCKAKINIIIKKNTIDTRKRDKFVKVSLDKKL